MKDDTRLLRLRSMMERLELLAARTSNELDRLLSRQAISDGQTSPPADSPRITLRYLNQLKKARKRQREEDESRAAFLGLIYGQPSAKEQMDKLKSQKAEIELERSALRLRQEIAKADAKDSILGRAKKPVPTDGLDF